jgi:hypothetical protein
MCKSSSHHRKNICLEKIYPQKKNVKIWAKYLAWFTLAFISLSPEKSIAASGDSFTLFSANMKTHQICRLQLDDFVFNAIKKFKVKRNVLEDVKSIESQEGIYIVQLHPKNNEIMNFSCRGDKLVVKYKFQ